MVQTVDAVNDRITHVEIAGRQIDPGAQGHFPILDLTVLHFFKQCEALFDRAVAIGRFGGSAQVAAVFAHLLGRQLTDISKSLFDQLHGALIHLVEILGGIIKPVLPVKAQPPDIFLDGVDILDVLLGRVGIVHAKIADAVILQRCAEVDADRFGVADMQVAVGLGRKARMHLHPIVIAALGDILFYHGVDKVGGHLL